MTTELNTPVKHNWEQTASGFHHTARGVREFMSNRSGDFGDLTTFSILSSAVVAGCYAGFTAGNTSFTAGYASAAVVGSAVALSSTVMSAVSRSILYSAAEHVAGWTVKHDDRIPTNQASRLQKRGRNLAAAFFVAISVASTGAGVLMVKEFDGQPEHNTGAMSQRFSVDGLNQQDCVVSFSKNNPPKILTGACTVNPS